MKSITHNQSDDHTPLGIKLIACSSLSIERSETIGVEMDLESCMSNFLRSSK